MFQVCIGSVLGSANTGTPVNFMDGGAKCRVAPLKVTIEGCPPDGIDAVDFRRAAGLPEAPHNKIELPPLVWIDEEFVRPMCDLRLEYHAPYLWACNAGGEVYETSRSDCVSVQAPAIVAYLAAINSASPHQIESGEGLTQSARALVLDALAAVQRSRVRAEAEAEKMRPEVEARKARQMAETREKAAAKVAAEKTLKAWALASGSDLLKARIAEKFEWLGLAEQEFAGQVVEALGEQTDYPTESEPQRGVQRPTLEEIEGLRRVRKLIEGKPAVADLRWMIYSPDEEDAEDENGETIKRAEIRVTVTCPTGRELLFFYSAEPKVQPKSAI